MNRWSRRQLVAGAGVTGLGLLAGCGRLPWQAGAPQALSVHRVGVLSVGSRNTLEAALAEGLRDLGYVEGQNLVIEYRWAERHEDQLPVLAAELAALAPGVIVTTGNLQTAQAARNATSTIPIVTVGIGDPVGSGLVASLARPGGNITGISQMATPLSGKRLEILKDVVPTAVRIAALWNPSTSLGPLNEVQSAARALGVDLRALEASRVEEIERAFEVAVVESMEGLLVVPDATLATHRAQIAALAAKSRLPTMAPTRLWVEAGLMMAYGVDLPAMYRRAATYVDKILKGTKPVDLPVEQPMTFDFVVNMKTARELGITFPQEILLQVTEVIDQ